MCEEDDQRTVKKPATAQLALVAAVALVAMFSMSAPKNTLGASRKQARPAPTSNLLAFNDLPASYRRRLALPETPRSSLNIPSNRFGTHTVILEEAQLAGDEKSVNAQLEIASQAGYTWIKDYVVGTAKAGTTPSEETAALNSQLNKPRYQWFFLSARKYRLRPLVRIDFRWTNGNRTTPGTESAEGRAAYALFCQLLAHRYREYVRDWEILNEPNAPTYDSSDRPIRQKGSPPVVLPTDYVLTLKQAYSAIKMEDPGARIYGPGLSYAPNTGSIYYKDLISAGLLSCIDVFSFHPYRDSDPIVARFGFGHSYLQQISALKSSLTDQSIGRVVPLAATEEGYSTYQPSLPATPDHNQLLAQAAWELKSEILDQEADISPRVNYLLTRTDESTPSNPGDRNYRIVDPTKSYPQLRPRPAYYAVQRLHAFLDNGLKPSLLSWQVINPSEGKLIRGFAFERSASDTDEAVLFLWKDLAPEPAPKPQRARPNDVDDEPSLADIRIGSSKWIAPTLFKLSPDESPLQSELRYDLNGHALTLRQVPISYMPSVVLLFPNWAANDAKPTKN